MQSFRIEGGHKLSGEIVPQGAKNEALQILCAVLLTSEPVTIHRVPDIRDANRLIELLRGMGVKEMAQCAHLIHKVLSAVTPLDDRRYELDRDVKEMVRSEVGALCARFPIPRYPN